jgi:hypothetical protein
MCLLWKWATLHEQQDLVSSVVTHADFGGVTSGIHLLSYQRVDPSIFDTPPLLPRVLAQIINAALLDAASKIARPDPLECSPCTLIKMGGVLQSEVLFNVFHPQLRIACPWVFKSMGWAHRLLLAWEHLQAFDIPLDMDDTLLDKCRERCIRGIIQWLITPLIVLAVYHAMWLYTGGIMGTLAWSSQG